VRIPFGPDVSLAVARLADDMQAVIYRRRKFKNWRLEIPDFAYDKPRTKGGSWAGEWSVSGKRAANYRTRSKA
jgi:hypothetical protein